ncbi:tripartite tricarboxylate transporter substrate binding protein [Roseomonas nepalensis]|uniref:Tripartite tricarboxylate transporter substrate binding protein n=1 Tax=Muricoccus nepalensis TaxID=1854500 RepID=A0A502F638_9PROT|nr:tripartite tricarboxylate transporter substrate binding protein [Roseomonas nepalensis]TPG44894.1 tripartite tricarboxylate transporter substrate binding protein [Roseomonas nepalensis]
MTRKLPSRRLALAWSLGAALLALGPRPALAETYPDRPLQIIMPLPPGSGTDLMARVFATELGGILGQRAVVNNRTGASLTIGMAALANAPADGYTLAFTPVTPIVVQTHRVKNLGYGRDSFVPICQTFENVFHVAVPPSSPFRDFRALVDHARANPGRLRYGHTGPASGPHLLGEQIWRQAGVGLVDVPYRGEADFATNLLSGTLDIGMATSFLVQSLNLRSLAVASSERLPSMPEVPTVEELGLGRVASVTYGGLFVRAGTPEAVTTRLEEACRRVVEGAPYREVAEKQAVRATYLGRGEIGRRMATDEAVVGALIRELHLEE